jgi:D-inositol-3-phosphate glycosyltransferase
MKVSLLTGGGDKPYALGLLDALISRDIAVDFIGNDDMSTAEVVADIRVNFLNLRGNQDPATPALHKIARVLKYYLRLLWYATITESRTFHILWLNKFILFDRSVLNLYYKLLGKKLVFTAHNIDDKERDGGNNIFNRASLRILYGLVDHIFVHTNKMKSDLIHDFSVPGSKISVIPFGINNTLPKSSMTRQEARKKLGLEGQDKVALFFGNIAPYKGLELALHALDQLRRRDEGYRLIIAGQIKDCQAYWETIESLVKSLDLSKHLIKKIEYIPDEEVETFFKASDVLLLPYKFIYQSGVLFLSYSFGLPVIATDVGSLREDIVEGVTGMVCRPDDPDDLADAINRFFDSDLYKNLEQNQKAIMDYGNKRYSWEEVASITSHVYEHLAKQ